MSQKWAHGTKANFGRKWGSSKFSRAMGSLNGASREKGLGLLRESVADYFEAVWIGRPLRDIDLSPTLGWVERPLQRLLFTAGSDVEQFFLLFDKLLEAKHDIDSQVADLVLESVTRSRIEAI